MKTKPTAAPDISSSDRHSETVAALRSRKAPDADLPLEVEIPGLELVSESNRRDSWPEKHRRTQRQRTIVLATLQSVAGLRTLRGFGLLSDVMPIDVTITRIAPRLLDPGGNLYASAKAVQDQIAFLLGVDDRHEDRVRYIVEQDQQPKRAAVRIQIKKR